MSHTKAVFLRSTVVDLALDLTEQADLIAVQQQDGSWEIVKDRRGPCRTIADQDIERELQEYQELHGGA